MEWQKRPYQQRGYPRDTQYVAPSRAAPAGHQSDGSQPTAACPDFSRAKISSRGVDKSNIFSHAVQHGQRFGHALRACPTARKPGPRQRLLTAAPAPSRRSAEVVKQAAGRGNKQRVKSIGQRVGLGPAEQPLIKPEAVRPDNIADPAQADAAVDEVAGGVLDANPLMVDGFQDSLGSTQRLSIMPLQVQDVPTQRVPRLAIGRNLSGALRLGGRYR